MNPRLKHIAQLPSVACAEKNESAAHLLVRPPVSDSSSGVASTFSTVEDEAGLLLSLSSICEREVKATGIDAIFDDCEEMPRFPVLVGPRGSFHSKEQVVLKPRADALLPQEKPTHQAMRTRSVSIDSPGLESVDANHRTTSPVSLPSALKTSEAGAILVSPITPRTVRRVPLRKQSQRLAKQQARDCKSSVSSDEQQEKEPMEVSAASASSKDKKGRTLQASPPKGVPTKTIGRKKFSWKCYPELERFLVANREEYLRHSALNYTIQQKQYNNRLTDELLELATKHGYLFDTQEFSFVTVRDRIRCYYKSFVQSAKKRGVLMGYAARKAGLLKDDDLLGIASSS